MKKRKPKGQVKKKRHTDRIRSKGTYLDQKTTAWAGNVGYLAGRGFFSTEIAERLGDGTNPAAIRKCFQRWGLPMVRHRGGFFVAFTPKMKARIDLLAKKHDTSSEEMIRRIAVCVIDDDMYEAVNDGRF